MTRSEAVKVVRRMAAAWPTPAWTRDTAAVYAAALAREDFNRTSAAVDALIRTRDRRPSVAAVLREVRPPHDGWVG